MSCANAIPDDHGIDDLPADERASSAGVLARDKYRIWVYRHCVLFSEAQSAYGSKNFLCGWPPKRPTAGISNNGSPGMIMRGAPGPFGMNSCG